MDYKEELEKLRLNFLRCENHDVAPLTVSEPAIFSGSVAK